jgi:hypothetical protein
MNPHLDNQPHEDQESTRPQERIMGARWRVPLFAFFVALLLQGGVLLALMNGEPVAGVGVSLLNLATVHDAHAAPLADDGLKASPGAEHDSSTVRVGIVTIRPLGQVGTWVIGDTGYAATVETELDGELGVGACAEVVVSEDAPTVALKITQKDVSKCGNENIGNNIGGKEFRGEWAGTILSVPARLLGEWTITVGEHKWVTFTADITTRFDPDSSAVYTVGSWVQVKVRRQPDGSLVADRIRVDEYKAGEIVVRLESAGYSSTLAHKYDLTLESTLLRDANIYLYATDDDHEQSLVSDIADEKGVIWAEVNYVNRVPEDDGYKTWGWGGLSEPDEYTDQSAFQQIRLGQTSRVYQGDGVVVAVLDTGIYTPHEQFVGKLELPSLDVIDDDTDPSEVGPGLSWGHGTHVAGIIAAVAPDAKILPVRVLDENGRGNTFLLAYAIEWTAQQPGVKVINLSLGTEGDSQILHDVIENVLAQGILVVAAAGNNNTNQIQYPAGYDGVISVTALDADSHKADFANYGENWVDVAAPGVGIMSTMINEDGPGYATWSGTSMATAFVSGAGALVAEQWSDQIRDASGVLDDGMFGRIVGTGVVVDALNPLFAGQIGRLLDVSAALGVQPMLLFMPQTRK